MKSSSELDSDHRDTDSEDQQLSPPRPKKSKHFTGAATYRTKFNCGCKNELSSSPPFQATHTGIWVVISETREKLHWYAAGLMVRTVPSLGFNAISGWNMIIWEDRMYYITLSQHHIYTKRNCSCLSLTFDMQSHVKQMEAELQMAVLTATSNVSLAFHDRLSPMIRNIFPDSKIALKYLPLQHLFVCSIKPLHQC